MTFPRFSEPDCMKLGTANEFQFKSVFQTPSTETNEKKKLKRKPVRLIRREIAELLFENCIDCEKMAAIPQGAFAVRKVRRDQNRGSSASPDEKEKFFDNIYSGNPFLKGIVELTPLQYNSKLMNSIWGLYNRYSVHNFKKNTDEESTLVMAWKTFLKACSSATRAPIAAVKTP